MNPTLSVVIPTFNRTEGPQRLLALLDRQKGIDLEVILVDQNPENLLSTLKLSNFPLKRILLDLPNASTARNLGYLHSRGDVILFLDDDSEPTPDFCARGVARVKSLNGLHCIWGLVTDENGVEPALKDFRRIQIGEQIGDLFEICTAGSSGILMSRETFRKSGGYDELLFRYTRTAEDDEFMRRAKKRGIRIWLDTSLPIYHDMHQTGGCELRTDDPWISRGRHVRAWVYRYLVHGGGRLTPMNLLQLCRSSFLNSRLFTRSPFSNWREIRLLIGSIRDTREFLAQNLVQIESPETVDHFAAHDISTSRKKSSISR